VVKGIRPSTRYPICFEKWCERKCSGVGVEEMVSVVVNILVGVVKVPGRITSGLLEGRGEGGGGGGSGSGGGLFPVRISTIDTSGLPTRGTNPMLNVPKLGESLYVITYTAFHIP
jgi:hypothetical protein